MIDMKTGTLLATAVLLAAAAACRPAAEEGRPTIQLVRDIAADKTDHRNALLHSLAAPDRHADIAIIGDRLHSNAIAQAFMTNDVRDNIDGTRNPDGLQDFSGECITVYVDDASSAPALVGRGEYETLRNFVVNEMLSAVDTVYNLAQFDLEGLGKKSGAKVHVLSDPAFEAYGKFDIDTLFTLTGCKLDVITPVHAMLDNVFEGREGKALTIGVLCDSSYYENGIYSDIIRQEFAARGASGSDTVILPIAQNDTTDLLQDFLDRFIVSGRQGALDALIVDDLDVDMEALRTRLGVLTSVTSAVSLTYRGRVSQDFRIIGLSEAITDSCFRILRERNLFSHDIAFPRGRGFMFIPRPDKDSEGFLTIPALAYVQD